MGSSVGSGATILIGTVGVEGSIVALTKELHWKDQAAWFSPQLGHLGFSRRGHGEVNGWFSVQEAHLAGWEQSEDECPKF